DDGVAGSIREIDEEAAACVRVRREGQAEQPLFAARNHRRTHIEKIGTEHDASTHRSDASVLLDDELHLAIEWIRYECQWRSEARRVFPQPQLCLQIGRERT